MSPWVSEQCSLLRGRWLFIQMCTRCISNAAYNSHIWHPDISCTADAKVAHAHKRTLMPNLSCPWSKWSWPVPLPPSLPRTRTVFNSVCWKEWPWSSHFALLFISLCSPLLHSFTHSSSRSYSCSISSFAQHAFPPCCLTVFDHVVMLTPLVCAAPYPSLLQPLPPPPPPPSLPQNSLFFSPTSGIQRMDYFCASCSPSSPLPVVVSHFLSSSLLHFSAVPSLLSPPTTLLHSFIFCLFPWTSDYLYASPLSSPTLGPCLPRLGLLPPQTFLRDSSPLLLLLPSLALTSALFCILLPLAWL